MKIPEISIPHQPFYLIRHGETDWNCRKLITGRQDISLNETGHVQAEQVAKILLNKNINHIASSSLQRTRQTADIINQTLKLPVTYCDDFVERGWGQAEGKPHETLKCLSNIHDKDLPEGAERYIDFQKRITGALKRILENAQGIPLIVAHGGVFVTLFHFFQHTPLHIKNCLPYLFMPPQDIQNSWSIKKLESNGSSLSN